MLHHRGWARHHKTFWTQNGTREKSTYLNCSIHIFLQFLKHSPRIIYLNSSVSKVRRAITAKKLNFSAKHTLDRGSHLTLVCQQHVCSCLAGLPWIGFSLLKTLCRSLLWEMLPTVDLQTSERSCPCSNPKQLLKSFNHVKNDRSERWQL